jgi:polyhydroxybutyrate depolymerase
MYKKVSFVVFVIFLLVVIFGMLRYTAGRNMAQPTIENSSSRAESSYSKLEVVKDEIKNIIKPNIVEGKSDDQKIKIGDIDRTYRLERPENKTTAKNLIVALHGNGGNGESLQSTLRLSKLVNENSTVIAYPNGLESGWNDIRVKSEDVDDIGFISQLTQRLQEEYTISKDKTTLIGVSNGGFMVQTLVCQNDTLARNMIAVISSQLIELAEQCKSFPSNSVYVLGQKDNLIPYEGGELKTPTPGSVLSAQNTLTNAAQINKCGEKSEEKESTTTLVQKINDCPNDGQIVLITYVNEGHISLPIKADFPSILKDQKMVL